MGSDLINHLKLSVNGKRFFHFRHQYCFSCSDLLSWVNQQSFLPKFYWKRRGSQKEIAALGQIFTSEKIPRFESDNRSPAKFFGTLAFSHPYKTPSLWDFAPQTTFFLPKVEISLEGKEATIQINALDDIAEIEKTMNQLQFGPKLPPASPFNLLSREDTPCIEDWHRMCSLCLNKIQNKEFSKAVLARKSSFELSAAASGMEILSTLPSTNSTKFAFQWSNQHCFIGSTPEMLFRRSGLEIYTEALAGTKLRGETCEEDHRLQQELFESAKEQQEFSLVKKFLIQALIPICEHLSYKEKEEILTTSNLHHLYNLLEGKLKPSIKDSDILSALHPTPALGGYPKNEALTFLTNQEPFDRGWYAAPIGWISQEESEFAVAIRSALFAENKMHLFSGVGIVEGSNPEQEWEELEQKIHQYLQLFPNGHWTRK